MAIALLVGQTALLMLLVSCNDDDTMPATEPIDKTEIFVERLTVLLNDMTTLFDGATFGERKGEYPVSSKKLLEDHITSLSETLAKVREGTKKLSNSDMDNVILETKKIEARFRSSVRSEDFAPIPAELNIYGKNGGYIDFGIHNEYSNFGNSGEQEFTVDFWVKLTDVDHVLSSFVFLISTFTDKDFGDGEHDRKGWNINLHMGNLRATYAMGIQDLLEPGAGFNIVDQWVHIALVTNEKGVDGETNGNKPVMMKMYVNGNLKLSETSNQDASKPYRSNDLNVPMVAFTGMSVESTVEGSKSTNGCLKHFHIWNKAKTQSEIQNIMNNPETVTGTESDMVCGWDLSKTVSDDSDIKDLTGKFSAKLIGDCRWVQ
jgi:hypothetical protein